MSDFIHQNFLLRGDAARRLYSDYAADQPIFDYHCHLSPKDLADNRSFKNLHEIWLEGRSLQVAWDAAEWTERAFLHG